ncbi:Aldedh domain-containing protein [Heracleum sosnowskyi]|uniref:Aldedh domain-containing protein n=1 Tax=Heracleum sosnowskyi TaxID=360622 RepID=A0AAD8HJI4_9APIA|nr:Aldedh domain-containing protein [Heracleum sosnowskyi]
MGKFKNLCKIVNKHHFNRLLNLLEDPAVAASIVYGGSLDEENLFIEPTIVLDPRVDAAIMEEEIFGPYLPIITLDDIHESIEFINSREKPLTIYAFTKDESLKKQILAETSSGSVTFSDAFVLNACDNLPFGGLADLARGLMRLAMGRFLDAEIEYTKKICRFVQDIYIEMTLLAPNMDNKSEMKKKMEIKMQSVMKIENACFSFHIRASEYIPLLGHKNPRYP